MSESPVKIVHVVTSLEPGGMENGVVNIANSLPPEFETHVCCLERTGDFASRLRRPDQVYTMGKTTGFSWRSVWNLNRALARIKPSVLHTHNLGALIYGALATGLGRRVPILHGEHSQLTGSEHTPRRLRQRRILYRCCRRIHAVSAALGTELADAGLCDANRIDVVINGVDTERFCPQSKEAARKEIGLPEDVVVIGIVGRFGPFKRHPVLIRAFEAIADRLPGVWLLIVGGGGSERESVTAQARASRHASRIVLAGFQIDPRPHYRAMTLLVIPSENEGMSNAALEAMACGVPVLASEACGNVEVITNGLDGVVADLSDSARLADKLFDLIEGREPLMEMSCRARETAVQRFSLGKMVDAYERLYRAVAASGN